MGKVALTVDGYFSQFWRLTVKFQSFWRLTVIKVARLEFLGGYLPRLSINYVGYGKKVTTTVLYKDENLGGIPPKKIQSSHLRPRVWVTSFTSVAININCCVLEFTYRNFEIFSDTSKLYRLVMSRESVFQNMFFQLRDSSEAGSPWRSAEIERF